MIIQKELIKISCKRCNHSWIPRVKNVRICPGCGTAYWDVEKKRKEVKIGENNNDFQSW